MKKILSKLNNGEKSKKIFLTSTGLTNLKVREAILGEIGKMQKQLVAIITTADDEKEKGHFCQLALAQFNKLGFGKVDFVDLERTPDYDFSNCGITYVSGGNTFRLLKFAKAVNFKKIINDLLDRGGVYIGVSAGSYIMCPTIEMSYWKPDPDRNDFGLDDLSAFNFVPFLLVVHYSLEYKDIIKKHVEQAKYPTRILTNEQAFFIKDGIAGLIGEGEEIKL